MTAFLDENATAEQLEAMQLFTGSMPTPRSA